MTRQLSSSQIADRINVVVPAAVVAINPTAVWIKREAVRSVCLFLRDDPDLCLDFLVSITGVDYLDYFEVIYHIVSLGYNHSMVLKTICKGRADLTLPSVVEVWAGANFQEREVYDLMGITFEGHPLLKRILLWEGFDGYPLRHDYIESRH